MVDDLDAEKNGDAECDAHDVQCGEHWMPREVAEAVGEK